MLLIAGDADTGAAGQQIQQQHQGLADRLGKGRASVQGILGHLDHHGQMRLGAAALEHEQAIARVHHPPALALDLLPHLGIAGGEVQASGPARRRVDRAALAAEQEAALQSRGGVGDPVEVAGQGRQAHHRQQHAKPFAGRCEQRPREQQFGLARAGPLHRRHPDLPGLQRRRLCQSAAAGRLRQLEGGAAHLGEGLFPGAVDRKRLEAFVLPQLTLEYRLHPPAKLG